MGTTVVVTESPIEAAAVGADLAVCGFSVGLCDEATDTFFQAVIRLAPELVVAVTATPSDLLLNSAALLNKVAPCPFVLFTTDTSPARIQQATEAGVHSYVIDGYAPRRLRSVINVATARFQQQQQQGQKLQPLTRDLRDRKQVERAKGLLMRSRSLGEEQAFELMRNLAMRRRLRLAAVADAVIALSIGAEAVNRSGALRMLAQRVARCFAQLTFGVHAEWAQANLRESQERIEANIAALRRIVADRGCAEDIARISATWEELRRVLAEPPNPNRIAAMDAIAGTLTSHAETLTTFLETAGLGTNLRMINLAGRQRMLCQQVGKLCLLLALDTGATPATVAARADSLQQAAAAFTQALAELTLMPVHTPDIDRWLAEAQLRWDEMRPFQRGEGEITRCIEVSERLLDVMESLTEAYEQAAQTLIGDRIDVFTA